MTCSACDGLRERKKRKLQFHWTMWTELCFFDSGSNERFTARSVDFVEKWAHCFENVYFLKTFWWCGHHKQYSLNLHCVGKVVEISNPRQIKPKQHLHGKGIMRWKIKMFVVWVNKPIKRMSKDKAGDILYFSYLFCIILVESSIYNWLDHDVTGFWLMLDQFVACES